MKKTCLDRGVTHLPSYHGLLWATAEPNFLHLLVKLGKPFTPKTKGWLGHPRTRSNLKPGQGETIRACPNAIVGSVKGVIFFFFSYIHKLRPLELTRLGGWSSIPEWLFFLKRRAQFRKIAICTFSLSLFFAPCPLNQRLCRIWGRHR